MPQLTYDEQGNPVYAPDPALTNNQSGFDVLSYFSGLLTQGQGQEQGQEQSQPSPGFEMPAVPDLSQPVPDAGLAGLPASPAPTPASTSAPSPVPEPQPGPQFSPPMLPPAVPVARPGDVAGAQRIQDAQIDRTAQAMGDAGAAAVDSAAGLANRRAAVLTDSARQMEQIDVDRQQKRDQLRQAAAAETASWMRDMENKAKEEPSNSRWFESKSTFGKAMTVLSLVFGSLAQANGASVNVGLELIKQGIDADIKSQRDRLAREQAVLERKGKNIDNKLAQDLADLNDDTTARFKRLTALENASLERANAPGPLEQRESYFKAAAWASQEKLKLAAQRTERASVEREGALNRDAEWRKALLVDQRERELSQISWSAKAAQSQQEAAAKFKENTRVLNPSITGIRVMNKQGQPVGPDAEGGFVVDKDAAKDVQEIASVAQERYNTLKDISRELTGDEDLKTIFKRNPKLVSAIQRLGYLTAKEQDPSGKVTDRDLTSGIEIAIGGDLVSLKGRLASATFSAGQQDFKKLVDEQIREMPKRMSSKLGHRLNGNMPGYQGNISVDWTPTDLDTEQAKGPNSAQIDARYGIQTPLVELKTPADLKRAQTLQKAGVPALPEYRQGYEAVVVEAIENFKDATPKQIEQRAQAAMREVPGDARAILEIDQARSKAAKTAEKALDQLETRMRTWYSNQAGSGTGRSTVSESDIAAKATEYAKQVGLGQISGGELDALLKEWGTASPIKKGQATGFTDSTSVPKKFE